MANCQQLSPFRPKITTTQKIPNSHCSFWQLLCSTTGCHQASRHLLVLSTAFSPTTGAAQWPTVNSFHLSGRKSPPKKSPTHTALSGSCSSGRCSVLLQLAIRPAAICRCSAQPLRPPQVQPNDQLSTAFTFQAENHHPKNPQLTLLFLAAALSGRCSVPPGTSEGLLVQCTFPKPRFCA
jgi:hypothetical protein